MRFFSFVSVGLLALTPLTSAWSKEGTFFFFFFFFFGRQLPSQNLATTKGFSIAPLLTLSTDREIFRIRDEISAHEVDPAATFYDILGITNSATLDDINKAYRKLTKNLHPDKVTSQLRADRAKKEKKDGAKKSKGPSQKEIKVAVKKAGEQQARLSLIANILRGEGRDRYDHYLSNGFPLWKGTDYLYDRYRPGFGTVLTGLFLVVGGGVHYYILYMNWKRHKEFVERYIKFARGVAWGENLNVSPIEDEPAPAPAQEEEGAPPQPSNRRERRMQEKQQKKEEGKGRVKSLKAKKNKSANASSNASRDASPGPDGGPIGARKRVVAENGKVLVVDSVGDVYLEERDDEGNVNEFLLDVSPI